MITDVPPSVLAQALKACASIRDVLALARAYPPLRDADLLAPALVAAAERAIARIRGRGKRLRANKARVRARACVSASKCFERDLARKVVAGLLAGATYDERALALKMTFDHHHDLEDSRLDACRDILQILSAMAFDLDVPYEALEMQTPLMLAAGYGPGVVQVVLDHGASVHACGGNGCPILVRAAHTASLEAVQTLLTAGADPAAVNDDGITPLMAATDNDNPNVLQALLNLKDRVDIEMRDANGRTALMHAVRNERPDTIALLLEAGADPNVPDAGGVTALMIAVGDRHDFIVKMLLEAGAHPNTADAGGVTALMLADDQGMVALLLEAGAES